MPRPSSLSRDVFEPVLLAAGDVEEIGRLLPTDPVESPEVEEEGDLRAEIVTPADGLLRLT